MERTWSNAPQRRGYDHHPSFSSTLLDAIYRSMDDERHGTVDAARTSLDRRAGGAPPGSASVSVAAGRKSAAERRNTTGGERASARRRGAGLPPPISTSSSSDNSSYGGFSSSEPESATFHPSGRLRPIRTSADVSFSASARAPPLPPPKSAPSKLAPSPPSPVACSQEKKKTTSIRSKLRDLRKSRTPASPGARLAGFINSLFASAGGNPRKSKGSPAAASSASAGESASSYSRSCLIKTPSSSSRGAREAAGKRSVSFHPVSVIVDEDLRPCGQKSVYEEDRAADRRMEKEAKRRAEELLRRLDDDGDDEGSDSSSDLFELEIGRGVGAGLGYRDELPVYETTSHHIAASNRPISHIF